MLQVNRAHESKDRFGKDRGLTKDNLQVENIRQEYE